MVVRTPLRPFRGQAFSYVLQMDRPQLQMEWPLLGSMEPRLNGEELGSSKRETMQSPTKRWWPYPLPTKWCDHGSLASTRRALYKCWFRPSLGNARVGQRYEQT